MPRGVRRRSQIEETRLKFDQKLVLNQWLLSLFEVQDFEALADRHQLKNPEKEGFDADNVSNFHHAINDQIFQYPQLDKALLLAYDENIVRHWQAITADRRREGQRLYPKYFQYLALLFTEIYLDRYFRDSDRLLSDLNEHMARFNFGKSTVSQIPEYEPDLLNKLAFWMATGSGKTLLMHVNILQYQYYLKLHNRQRELNRVILLTPNEGLSRQHLDEFRLSGMDAEIFSKEGRGLFSGRSVEILDIHKLREEMGEKTIAVDAFEGNNLVLVDEGHRGTSGTDVGLWMKMRDRICDKGFSFEYSATFGQAVRASNNPELEPKYARCIICDYSYKYFYRDGYGKDYHILNLEDDSREEVRQLYLTACLLAFYQQLRLFQEKQDVFRSFLIERPLWVFVGGKVTAVRSENNRQVSDVLDILLNLSEFIRDKSKSTTQIQRLLSGNAGLLDPNGREIFANTFAYLVNTHLRPEEMFSDILKVVFNSSTQAALHVELLKGSEGEIALRLGDNDSFGVINVGDAPKLWHLCEEQPDHLTTSEREFSGSLFHGLSGLDSTINLLIGSKKFSEGWNSWRVSTMGLMNVGRAEGSEIIQLFGRGVRLKGWEYCLKRTSHAEVHPKPDPIIKKLETLNIFGIRADYMRTFKEMLEEEGLPTDDNRLEIKLPVLKHLSDKPLRMIRLKEGLNFKKDGPKPKLAESRSAAVQLPRVIVDWCPRIQSRRSIGIRTEGDIAEKKEGQLTADHSAFIDMESIFFEMENFKNERSWYNLTLSRDAIEALLLNADWYTLFIPQEELNFTDFNKVRQWQEIAIALLKKYCDRYYKFRKNEYELPNLEYHDLDLNDPNFFDEYSFLVDQSQETVIERLKEIAELVRRRELKDVAFPNGVALAFGQHLYEPLIHLRSDLIEVRPVPLNDGELDFVEDLRRFYNTKKDYFTNKEMYLLRNLSRGKGIGFFEAGNYYPDFIMWLVIGDRQYVSFIDPKGIRNSRGKGDEKIGFCKTVKEIQDRLGDPKVILNSFIVSNTRYNEIPWEAGGMTKEQLEEQHVLFQQEDKDTYIGKLLALAVG